MISLSLIIPCYNEAKNMPLLLPRCEIVAARANTEVVLVDNGSQDDTAEVLRELLPRYPGCRSIRVDVNQGFGFGVLSGLCEAKGDVLAWTHADIQTDAVDALTGIKFFEQAQDPRRIFVKGRRYGRPFADVFFTVGMSMFESALLAQPLWDINAQPVMFHRAFFDTWRNPPNDFGLELFAYFCARRARLEVHRFPVLFSERAHGVSSWNVNWSAKLRFIRRTFGFSVQLRRRIASL